MPKYKNLNSLIIKKIFFDCHPYIFMNPRSTWHLPLSFLGPTSYFKIYLKLLRNIHKIRRKEPSLNPSCGFVFRIGIYFPLVTLIFIVLYQ
jgi:hypothetical protein